MSWEPRETPEPSLAREQPHRVWAEQGALVTGSSSLLTKRNLTGDHAGHQQQETGQEQEGGDGEMDDYKADPESVPGDRDGTRQLHSSGEEWESSLDLCRGSALWPKVWLGVPGEGGRGG